MRARGRLPHALSVDRGLGDKVRPVWSLKSIDMDAALIQKRGGRVAVIMTLLDRQEGGREAIEAAGHKFRAIFTRAELQ